MAHSGQQNMDLHAYLRRSLVCLKVLRMLVARNGYMANDKWLGGACDSKHLLPSVPGIEFNLESDLSGFAVGTGNWRYCILSVVMMQMSRSTEYDLPDFLRRHTMSGGCMQAWVLTLPPPQVIRIGSHVLCSARFAWPLHREHDVVMIQQSGHHLIMPKLPVSSSYSLVSSWVHRKCNEQHCLHDCKVKFDECKVTVGSKLSSERCRARKGREQRLIFASCIAVVDDRGQGWRCTVT